MESKYSFFQARSTDVSMQHGTNLGMFMGCSLFDILQTNRPKSFIMVSEDLNLDSVGVFSWRLTLFVTGLMKSTGDTLRELYAPPKTS